MQAAHEEEAHHSGVPTYVPTFSAAVCSLPPTFTQPLDVKEQANNFHRVPVSSTWVFLEISFTFARGLQGLQRHTWQQTLFPARPAQGIPALILSVLGDSRVCSLCCHLVSSVYFHLLSILPSLWLQTKPLHMQGLGHLLPGFPKEKSQLALVPQL